jgi:uncharacterized protein involved in exopolysaccharide biosynthesis
MNLNIAITQAESKFSELSQRLSEAHPQYQAAKAELDKLKSQLLEATSKATTTIGGTAHINQQRESELSAALAAQKARVLELNLTRDELSVLQRDVENAQRAMDTASQRFTQTTLEGSANQADIAVLTRASAPRKAASPRVFLNVLLSIFIGSILGIGLGLLVEMIDRRVRSREDLSDDLKLPVFAVIKSKSRKNDLNKFGFMALSSRLFRPRKGFYAK